LVWGRSLNICIPVSAIFVSLNNCINILKSMTGPSGAIKTAAQATIIQSFIISR